MDLKDLNFRKLWPSMNLNSSKRSRWTLFTLPKRTERLFWMQESTQIVPPRVLVVLGLRNISLQIRNFDDRHQKALKTISQIANTLFKAMNRTYTSLLMNMCTNSNNVRIQLSKRKKRLKMKNQMRTMMIALSFWALYQTRRVIKRIWQKNFKT